MHLLWPNFLYLLALIPLLAAVYARMLRRRQRFAVRYASLALVRDAVPPNWRWLRHLPFGLFLLALGCLVVACARPYTVSDIPADQSVIILALDVSRSMCSTDIPPNRLQAAESAALDFIHRQTPTTQVGLIAFSSFAELIQPPTADPERLQNAVGGLMLGSTTAIGSGILRALDAIAEVDPGVSPSQLLPPGQSELEPVYPPPAEKTGQPEALSRPDIIILLTDGVSNSGPEPLTAARQAAERGVRVYTIGYGTADGALYPSCPSDLIGSDPTKHFIPIQVDNYMHHQDVGGYFQDEELAYGLADGSANGGASGFPRGIDEQTLQQVSALTGGVYYPAESASELHHVFRELSSLRLTRQGPREASVAFAALGALLAATAIALSQLWRPL